MAWGQLSFKTLQSSRSGFKVSPITRFTVRK